MAILNIEIAVLREGLRSTIKIKSSRSIKTTIKSLNSPQISLKVIAEIVHQGIEDNQYS